MHQLAADTIQCCYSLVFLLSTDNILYVVQITVDCHSVEVGGGGGHVNAHPLYLHYVVASVLKARTVRKPAGGRQKVRMRFLNHQHI